MLLDRLCDVNTYMRIDATRSSLEYIRSFFDHAVVEGDKRRVYDLAVDNITLDGLVLEFGVFMGSSINYFAKKLPKIDVLTDKTVHGFNSFEGLPEDWMQEGGVMGKKGTFTLGGVMPKVEVQRHPP